jgi:hypothetical protein
VWGVGGESESSESRKADVGGLGGFLGAGAVGFGGGAGSDTEGFSDSAGKVRPPESESESDSKKRGFFAGGFERRCGVAVAAFASISCSSCLTKDPKK